MGFTTPRLPDIDLDEWRSRPHHRRLEPLAKDWALNGFGTPEVIYFVYLLKIALYILGAMLVISATSNVGGIGDFSSWWTQPITYQKFVVWTLLWEILGLGCGSLPLTLRFLLTFQVASLDPMITVREYFSFVISLVVSFGVAFEMPIAVVLLTMLGLVTPSFLRKFRRHAAVLCFVLGAFLSPGDAITATIAMAVPLYVLYEMSVFLSYLVQRRRVRRAAVDEAANAGAVA